MHKRLFHLICGPVLFALCLGLIPQSVLPLATRTAVGTMLWMGWWWVSMPVNPAVTALLPIAVNAFFNLVPMSSVTSLYFSDIVVLLLGASMISATWEITGLDKRLAVRSLMLLGPSVKTHIVVWFLVSVVLSSVLPNAVVCALLVPICAAMIRFLSQSDKSDFKPLLSLLFVGIAWGCGLGGLGTPLGGAMNLVAVSYLEQITGHEYFYMDWVVKMVPMMLILVAATLIFLLILEPKNLSLAKTREFIRDEAEKLPELSRDEIYGLVLFITPLVLSFARELYAAWCPGLKPAQLFLICGLISFVLTGKNGKPFATWEQVCPKIEWQLLLLFAGGLALGLLLTQTGATKAVAGAIAQLHLGSGIALLLVIIAVTMIFVEVASNTAAAAIAVPMVISLAHALGEDPVPYVYITAAAFNTGFMFPTSIRAIPIAYGLNPTYLFLSGAVMTSITVVLIALAGRFLFF
ncbi:MAG TPA: Di-and tricarboxylate transporter [Sutterella sp.]|nr:Di-and tricarboxylate transporter [Sutterella sp.]